LVRKRRRCHASGRKFVEAANLVCASKLAMRLRRVVRVPSNACEPSTSRNGAGSTSTFSMMRAAIRSGFTRSQPVLGIEHPQEAIGGSLIVHGHELCDPRAAVAEFGARAARLNNRNADPEGCNFLRDGFDEPFNAPLRGLPRVKIFEVGQSLTMN
jgi:hypothetical protein